MADTTPGSPGYWLRVEGIDDLPQRVRAEGAFLPSPLGPQIRLRDSTYRVLGEAERAIGGLDEAAARLPRDTTVEVATWVRDAQSVLGLNGSFESCRALLVSRLPHTGTSLPMDPVVARLLEADNDAVLRVRRGEPVAATLLGRTAAILAGTPVADLGPGPGRVDATPWRRGHQWLGGADPAAAYLLAPPPDHRLRTAVADWAAWNDGPNDLPLLCKVALGHYQLAVLAPVEMSGHLASLYMMLELIAAKALRDQFLPISTWLDGDRDLYREHLRGVVDRADFDGWVRYVAERIRDLCRSQIHLVRDLELKSKKFSAALPRRNDAAARVVSKLISVPVFDVNMLHTISGVSTRQTYNLIKEFARLGLVRRLPKNFGKVFEVIEVVELLNEYATLLVTQDDAAFDDSGH